VEAKLPLFSLSLDGFGDRRSITEYFVPLTLGNSVDLHNSGTIIAANAGDVRILEAVGMRCSWLLQESINAEKK
jgi:hypothetical protein